MSKTSQPVACLCPEPEFCQGNCQDPMAGGAYDCLFCRYNEGVYAIYPSIAFQSDSPSGNTKYLKLERRRRFFGGFKRIQKFNEFFTATAR